MRDQICSLAIVAMVAAALGGCAAADHGVAADHPGAGAGVGVGGVNSNLVLPSSLMDDLEAVTGRPAAIGSGAGPMDSLGYLSRNDAPAAAGDGIPDFTGIQVADYWHRERLRITNGRPRENSTFGAWGWWHRGAR